MAFLATKRLRTATRYADDGTADVLLCDEELVADVALVGAIGNLYHVVVMRRSMCHVRMCELELQQPVLEGFTSVLTALRWFQGSP